MTLRLVKNRHGDKTGETKGQNREMAMGTGREKTQGQYSKTIN